MGAEDNCQSRPPVVFTPPHDSVCAKPSRNDLTLLRTREISFSNYMFLFWIFRKHPSPVAAAGRDDQIVKDAMLSPDSFDEATLPDTCPY